MTQWQLHRENMASQAGLGYRVQNGASVLYSSVTHTDEEPDGGRSFCLSRERDTMQQLNQRLAWYLTQVQFLEAANEKLEIQIQEVLDEKFPKDLTELEGNLTTSSMLQEQICSYLTDQAQLKLHLLNTELTVCDFRLRCEKEIERRECVEAEINKLRMKEEELHVHRLPELHGLLNDQTQELMQLQMQHQQDSGAPAVQMLPAEPSLLTQQLDNLRLTSVAQIDQNTDQCWFNNLVSMDHPAESEVAQAEYEHLRRTTFSLEEELTQLQAHNMMLEAAGMDQNESFVVELAVLEQRADGLCTDLESLLQASEHQAAEHRNLLDIKSRLQTQIQDYIRLLDGQNPQGVSSLHSSSWTNVTSSPSAFRRNLRAMDVQRIPRSQICSFGHTLVDLPLSKPVNTLQSNWVHSQTNYSPRTSINTVNLNGSFTNRFGSLPEKTERQSVRISRVIKRPRSPTVDKVHDEDRALQNSLIVDTNVCLDKETSKPEINTAHRFSMMVPKSHPVRIAAIQLKPDTFTSTETTTYAEETEKEINTTILCVGSEVNLEGRTLEKISTVVVDAQSRNIQTNITTAIPCAEPEVKQGSHFETYTTTTYPSKRAASEAKKETDTVISAQTNSSEGSFQTENRDLTQVVSETVVEEVLVTGKISAQMNSSEGSIQTENQDNARVVSLSLDTPEESVKYVEEVVVTGSVVTESQILKSEETKGKIPDDLTKMHDKDTEQQEIKGEDKVVVVQKVTSPYLRLYHSSALSDASNSQLNKVMENADTGSCSTMSSSSSPGSNDNLESKTARTEILKIVELEVNKGKVVNSIHDAKDKDVNPTQSDNEMVNVEGQEGLLSSTESKMAESLKEPVKSREICPNPYETEVSMSVTDQECVDSPDTSPNDTHTSLGPNGEKQEDEDEEVRLILTKANLYVKPTTDEGRSLSLSRFQALSEKDTNGKVSISAKDENNEESNSITKPTGSTNQATSLQLSSSLGGLKFGGPNTVGIADNKYVQNVGHGSEDQKENPSMKSEVMGKKNSEKVFVKSDSSGSVPANEETTICSVERNSGGIVSRKSDLASGFGGTAVSSSGKVRGDAEASIKAEVQGTIRHGNGKSMIYGSSLSSTNTGSKESLSRAALPATGQPETGKFSSRGAKEWMVYGAGLRRNRSLDSGSILPSERKEEEGGPSEATNSAMGTQETRFGRRGSGEWMVYGGSIGSRTSSSGTRNDKSPSVAPAFSVPDLQRVGGSEEWRVDSCNLKRASSLSGGESLTNSYSRENRTMVTSPAERRRCDSKGSGDLRVYGGGAGRMSSWAGSCSLPNADSEEIPSVAAQLETNPPGSRKLGSLGSGEWRVYAGSTGSVTSVGSVGSTDRVSVIEKYNQLISPPSSHGSSGLRPGSAGRLSTGSFVKRSGSVGSGGGRVSGAGSGSRLSNSSGSHISSSTGRLAMTGGNRTSSPGSSGSKLSRAASSEVISSRTGGRVAGSSGSGRSNVTGGRVISSSIRQIRNPGSGVGGSKERISVCKMAALSISAAAGRERSQGKQGQQQKQKQDPKTSPLLQRWLSTGVGVTCDDPDDSDDDMRP